MTIYHSAGATPSWSGESIGIMVLNCQYPFIPGNVANASSYSYPVRYAEVTGATIERLLYDADPTLLEPFIDAAQQLQREGVQAITGACGFMALFQKELQASVDIPVFASSLLQVPFMHSLSGKAVGIITADSSCLRQAHFNACDISKQTPVIVAGMETVPAFAGSVLANAPLLDNDAVEKGAVAIAKELVSTHPEIGSILLECSDLPPYAHAIQSAVNLPVFDFITMIDYVKSSLRRSLFVD